MSELCLSGSEKLFSLNVIGVSCEGLGFGCCSKEEKGDAQQAEIQRMDLYRKEVRTLGEGR